MPKSSIATCTPVCRISRKTASVGPVASTTVLSVTSRTSRSEGTPCTCSRVATVAGKSASCSCRGETLTAISIGVPCSSQRAHNASDRSSTRMPNGMIRPLSSATPMKAAGGRTVPSRSRRRTSDSAPTVAPVLRSISGCASIPIRFSANALRNVSRTAERSWTRRSSSGRYSSMRSRPRSFALLSATSACRSSSSASTSPSLTATPTLTRMECVRPSISRGCATAARISSPISNALATFSRAPLKITNSSAPSLPTVSASATVVRTRSAISRSTRSPVSWPRLSLNCLKPSRSQHHSATPAGTFPTPRAARRSMRACRLKRSVNGSWVARCTRPASAARVAVTSSRITRAKICSECSETAVVVATTVSSLPSLRRNLTSRRCVLGPSGSNRAPLATTRRSRLFPASCRAGVATRLANASLTSRTLPRPFDVYASRAVGTGERSNMSCIMVARRRSSVRSRVTPPTPMIVSLRSRTGNLLEK